MLRQVHSLFLLTLSIPTLSLGLASNAHAFIINAGEVPAAGTETYTITCDSKKYPKECPTGTVTVTVNNLTKGEKPDKKIMDIVDAFTSQQPFLMASELGTASVRVPGATAVITGKGTTGEDDTFAMANGPGYGRTAFTGDLTGFGYDGTSAGEYLVAFGYDGLSINSDITYTSLAVKTLGGLATATYDDLLAQLPMALQADLSLNPATDEITFRFPDSASNPFVSAAALDPGVTRTLTLAVPEPATWAMMLAGFGMTGAIMRRRRPPERGPADVNRTGWPAGAHF